MQVVTRGKVSGMSMELTGNYYGLVIVSIAYDEIYTTPQLVVS